MSLENVDLIKEMYVAFHGGDAGRALSYFDEDVVVDATVRVDGGIGHGREELSRIIGQWVAMFDGWHEEIEEMRDLGDRVCVVARQGGRAEIAASRRKRATRSCTRSMGRRSPA